MPGDHSTGNLSYCLRQVTLADGSGVRYADQSHEDYFSGITQLE